MAKRALAEIVSRATPDGSPPAGIAKMREDLANGKLLSPRQHHVLARMIRFLPGGRETFIGLLRRAARNGDRDAVSWCLVYDELKPHLQKKVDLDDLSEASGVQPDALLGIVVSTGVRMGTDVSVLVAQSYAPQVVDALGRSALRTTGEDAKIAQRDREMLLQHTKFLPLPHGAAVHVHANANAQAAAAAAAQPSVPTFAESLEGATQAHRDIQRQIASDHPVDEGEFEEAQE